MSKQFSRALAMAALTILGIMPILAARASAFTYEVTVTLGNGVGLAGAGKGPAVPSAPVIDSSQAGFPGADPARLARCLGDFLGLDPAKVAGKIVICTSGGNSLIEKARAVEAAGGAGVIIANPVAGPTLAVDDPFVFFPIVHVDVAEGDTIRAYARASGSTATASLGTSRLVGTKPDQINARGTLLDTCTAIPGQCSRFSYDVSQVAAGPRKGETRGTLRFYDAATTTSYVFRTITGHGCADGSGSILHAIDGTATGAANRGKIFQADATITATSRTTGQLEIAIFERFDPVDTISGTFANISNGAFSIVCGD